MNMPANSRCLRRSNFGYRPHRRHRQHGMGATIVLFTIALIVLVGAALAYASRGNPSAINTQSARVYAGVLMQQSADYRDAYSRFIFDGGVAATMTFNTLTTDPKDLFYPAAQYGVYQVPPVQSLVPSSTANWLYNSTVAVNGVGTAAPESVTFVPYLSKAVCEEINYQLYGVKVTAPASNTTIVADLISNTATPIDSTPIGRSSGCVNANGTYVFYSTLGEA